MAVGSSQPEFTASFLPPIELLLMAEEEEKKSRKPKGWKGRAFYSFSLCLFH
jgi:hypothetical protein